MVGIKEPLDNQKYIRENVNIGDEVVLSKKIVNNAFVKVKYDILHNGKCIGMMSDEFTRYELRVRLGKHNL